MADFESGRATGGDLEGLFRKLEQDLGLDSGGEMDEEDSGALEMPGALEVLIQEFEWECSEQGQELRASQKSWLECLAEFGQHLVALEDLSDDELRRFICFWILERGELKGADQAREFLEVLERFCCWAEEGHDHPLASTFGSEIEALRETFPRVVELNRYLVTLEADAEGRLYEVIRQDVGQPAQLKDRHGNLHEGLLEPQLSGSIRPGDHLRAEVEPEGRLRVLRVYPPQAARLVR